MPDIDALSDGGFCEMGTYPGIVVPEPGVNSALASALRHLNPAEVQRRRNLLGELNEYEAILIISFIHNLSLSVSRQ